MRRRFKIKYKKRPQVPEFAQNQFGDYVCFFDGACEPKNPGGNMGVGALIEHNSNRIMEESFYIAAKNENSNNVAEYIGLITILDYLIANCLQEKRIVIYGDSNLVIMQMNGFWKIREGRYVEYAKEAQEKLAGFTNTKLFWIPREHNQKADELSKSCMIANGCEFKIQPL